VERYIWVGRYESDIKEIKLFCGSITIYGSDCVNNHSFSEQKEYTDIMNDFIFFTYKKIKEFIAISSDMRFLFYDELWAYNVIDIDKSVKDYFILFNSRDALSFLSNKTLSRIWLSTELNIPPFISATKDECEFDYLKKHFPGKYKFVIQENISEGGAGTFLLEASNKTKIKKILRQSHAYLVAPYLDNSIALNATIIIRDDGHIVFPCSKQVLSYDDTNIIFIGSDFISSINAITQLKEKIDLFLASIIKKLKSCGYRGIIGVDFLIYNDSVYFIEFNPRFQGSTFLINKAIDKDDISIYELVLFSYIPKVKNNLHNQLAYNNLSIYYCYASNNLLDNQKPTEKIIDGKRQENIRYIYNTPICYTHYQYNMTDYYDYFAEKYHLILPDVDEAINSQGIVLKEIIQKYSRSNVKTILDCTCGIGIQTISLAALGYIVYGSDISNAELEIAVKETKKRNLAVKYCYADLRELEKSFENQFDAIISIDNAMSHLLTEKDFTLAFKSIFNRLYDGGIFLASFRDYDSILEEKPVWAYSPRLRKEGETTFITVRNFEWDGDICTSHQYFIENNNGRAVLFYNKYKQWAITRDKIARMVENTSFSECFWLFPQETNFYQPILALIK